jgi:cell division protease FtsH
MRICCGGRIAEKIFTGDISTGAAMDIAQATRIAREMICRFGMSERFGFQAFQEPTQFTGAELPPAFSEETSREIDSEVKKLIDEAYADAERIIGENRDKLESLARELIEKETMDGRDVEAIIKGTAVEEPKSGDSAEGTCYSGCAGDTSKPDAEAERAEAETGHKADANEEDPAEGEDRT